MTRKEREYYSKAKPLAVMGITNNCELAILEICAYVCGIHDKKGE